MPETWPLMEELTIHRLLRSDRQARNERWESYNAFYGRAGPTALSVEVTQATWSDFSDAGEPVYALVAEKPGSIEYRKLLG